MVYSAAVANEICDLLKQRLYPRGQCLLHQIQKMNVAAKAHTTKGPKVLSKSKNKKPLLAQLRDRPYAINCEAEGVD